MCMTILSGGTNIEYGMFFSKFQETVNMYFFNCQAAKLTILKNQVVFESQRNGIHNFRHFTFHFGRTGKRELDKRLAIEI